MAVIQNFPQPLLNEHHHWHQPSTHGGAGGGRENPFGSPGGGLEFLQFHRDFVARFRAWYEAQPGADLAAITPWTAIPAPLKVPAVTNWNSSLATQEQRIVSNAPPFGSADELGEYIEGGIHNWIHGATASAFNEPIVAGFHSPQSTYFYQIHGLVDRWWRTWESGQTPPQVTNLTVGSPAAQASIARPGAANLFTFEVSAAGRFTMETQGQLDLVMSLYGPNNLATFIAEDDDSGAGNNSRIERNLAPGRYFLRVRHYSPQATGNYSISVQRADIAVPAIPVNGALVQGNIAVPGEMDLFTFSVANPAMHTIETAGNTDTFITLFGPNSQSTLITEDDDSGPSFNSRIVTPLAAGNYFVRVRHYSASGTGTYSIGVRR